jgi:transcriptional regulator GlxA family with amidase domain
VRLQKLLESRKQLQAYYQNLPKLNASLKQTLNREDQFISKVLAIMEEQIGNEQFDINELCKTLGVSRAQLYRKFKALTGQSVGRHFRLLRLQKANALLQSSNLNITQIAFETGFKDPAYFTRRFKEEFGKTPREMRK